VLPISLTIATEITAWRRSARAYCDTAQEGDENLFPGRDLCHKINFSQIAPREAHLRVSRILAMECSTNFLSYNAQMKFMMKIE
jgi:hypothetical protein